MKEEKNYLVKKYENHRYIPWRNEICCYNSWVNYSYNNKFFWVSMFVESSLGDDTHAIEDGIVAFCDVIHDHHENHLVKTEPRIELQKSEFPAKNSSDRKSNNIEFVGYFDERFEVLNNRTNSYKLYFNDNDIYLIVFFNGEYRVDDELLNKAFLNFSEKYLESMDVPTV